MPSFATFVVFLILALALLVVLPKLRAAESNSVEPLTVRIIPPKSVSAVTPVMAEPLRAPVPSVETIVAFAQQLSISDPTAEVDDLLSSFSSFSMKATLPRSCLKRDRRMPSHRRVHFQSETISEVHLIEISPGKIVRSGDTSSSIRPHIPGNKVYRSHPNGQLYMLKTDGVFNSPGPSHFYPLRCGNIRHYGRCESCLVPRRHNVLVDRDFKNFRSIGTPRTWPANLPYYT
ncbi:hypothetical protein BGZ57DRAFT_1005652 [Hyaloscypha finlandica]|nr:hypothetical protein BGZ57DRAFT_1005652 [Hyaloscypha finlandica]